MSATYVEDTEEPDFVIVGASEKNDEFLDAHFDGAREAEAEEKSMPLLQGLKLYPKAAFWSLSLSLALMMVGYDGSLMSTFYAFPAFAKKYGHEVSPGKYAISAPWQSGLSNAIACGEILGLLINGYASDRFGYRRTMIVTYMFLIGLIFIPFFAPNIVALFFGQVFNGMGWGIFITLTTTYASEVCPIVLRYYLASWVNLCWVFGDLLSAGVLRALLGRTDQWSYKIPFALEWIFPVPLMILVFLAPESPWWLVRKNKIEEAVKSVKRLTTKGVDANFDAQNAVSNMAHTVALETRIYSTSKYVDCFRGTDLRRTEIACCTWMIQALCGSAVLGYATYFFESAGLNTIYSFDMGMAKQALGIVGTLISWVASGWFGRRTLFFWGLICMTITMFTMGFVSLAPRTNHAANWAIGALLLVAQLVYEITIAAPTYVIVPEISSSKLRPKTLVLARNAYNVAIIGQNVLIAYMLNAKDWNWGGKTGYLYGGINLICLTYVYFRLPETKGRSYGELEVLFEKKIAARKFSSTEVDPFEISVNPEDVAIIEPHGI
jgi:SP family general alpha glucoside:H+ symporter-like MFS transporter